MSGDTTPGADSPDKARRDQGGRFQRGRSGNPSGKPPGTRNKTLVLLDKIGEESAEAVVRAIIESALAGDTKAGALLLERIWPARRGRPITLNLPAIRTAADVTAAMSAVSAAVSDGELSAEEGQSIAALFEAQRRAIETVELEARLAALEQKLNQGDTR